MSDKLGGTPAPRPRPGTYPIPAPVAAPRPGAPRPGAPRPGLGSPPPPGPTAYPAIREEFEEGWYRTETSTFGNIHLRDETLSNLAEEGWILVTTAVVPGPSVSTTILVDTFRWKDAPNYL
jgi:hypothetical protein